MIGDFDSILSDEEAQRLESAFQALGAASANGERSVSEAEERAWFAHLQQGDARGQRALAWRLTGKWISPGWRRRCRRWCGRRRAWTCATFLMTKTG